MNSFTLALLCVSKAENVNKQKLLHSVNLGTSNTKHIHSSDHMMPISLWWSPLSNIFSEVELYSNTLKLLSRLY